MRAWFWLLLLALSACVPLDAGPVPPTGRPKAQTPTTDGDARGPSTAEERARAVEAARRLEADPLAYGADEERARWTVWVMQIPDIMVKTCAALIEPVEAGPTRSLLSGQMLLASAAFIIEHPKKANDDLSVFTAALESVLRTYVAMLATQPESRHSFLDGLVVRKREGKLQEYVRDAAADCGG